MKWGAALPLLLGVLLVRLWIVPLSSSFWVDEMGTAFVVRYGADHPSFAVAPQVPESVYYVLPRAMQALFGFSEIAYRVPSLLAMAAALWLIARLAVRWIHPEAGWFAAMACLSLRGFNYQAADARPYALGTLVACACVWFLWRWRESGAWSDALGVLVCAALLWRVQLIFWPFYVVVAVEAVVLLRRRRVQALEVFGALAVALVPVVLRAFALYRQAGEHVVAPQPGARELLQALKLGLPLACGGGAWVLSRAFRGKAERPGGPVALLVVWWLSAPLCLFAFSRLTGQSVFVPRYLWLSLPAVALLATWCAARFLPVAWWKPTAVALGVGVLLLNGPSHQDSDWRGAARQLQALGVAAETPVICPSPFIEARAPAWRPDYPLPGFLYAHLAVYPIPGTAYLFPYGDAAEAEEMLARAGRFDRFAIYGQQGQVDFWCDRLGGRKIERRRFGDVEVAMVGR